MAGAAALALFVPAVADAGAGDTWLVSTSLNSTNGAVQPDRSISADGGTVVFTSDASTLVPATRTASATCSCATSRRGRRRE